MKPTADLKSNEVPGKYQATVTVNYLGQSSLVKLNQENAFPYGTPAAVGHRLIQKHGFFTKRTVLIIAGVAVAGAIGAIARRVSSILRHPAWEFTDYLALYFGRMTPAC